MKELCGVNDTAGLQLGHPAQFTQQLGERQQGKKRKERSPQVHAGKAAN